MGLNILIVGAGVCGPALASLLLRSRQGHRITIIERYKDLRVAGQQIDIKDHVIPLMRSMELLDTVRQHSVEETGLEVVDAHDKTLLTLGVSPGEAQGFTLTTEYEIMRGDLVRVLYNDSLKQYDNIRQQDPQAKEVLDYKFNTTITALEQSDTDVRVDFSNGESATFDLVVAADGQRSRTRTLAFGSEADDAFHPFGVHSAYWTVPRVKTEGGLARVCFTPDRWMFTRTSGRPVTGAYVFTTKNHTQIAESYRQPIDSQKQIWCDTIAGSVWQERRFIESLRASEDFFAHEQGQVKMSQLSKGRVVLLGDAGYCPSPFTGQGTTLALQGAHILAGEIASHGDDVAAALAAYQIIMRPVIEHSQQLWPGGPKLLFIPSSWGIWLAEIAFRTMAILRIDKLINQWMLSSGTAKESWKAPVYEQLNLASPDK